MSAFLLCWGLGPVLFFSISKSKLPGYILPAIPAIAMILVRVSVKYANEYRVSLRWFSAVAACGFGIVGATVRLFFGHLQSTQNAGAARAAAALLIGFAMATLGLVLWSSGQAKLRRIAPIGVLPVLVLLVAASNLIPRFLPTDPSGKILASELLAAHVALDQVYAGPIRRTDLYALSFYVHHEIAEWNPADPHEGYLLRPFRRCGGTAVTLPFRCEDNPIELQRSGWFVYRVKVEK